MTEQPIYAVPGVCLTNSVYASGKQFGFTNGRVATGRYSATNNVEFIAGFPQKVAGYSAIVSSGITGTPRCMKTWRDNNGVIRLAIGTDSHVYTCLTDGSSLTDITPRNILLRKDFAASICSLTVSSGSTDVTVSFSGADAGTTAALNGMVNGDYVALRGVPDGLAAAISLAGLYRVSSVVAGTSFHVTAGTAATQLVSGVVMDGTIYWYKVQLGASPFATTSGSPTVTVTMPVAWTNSQCDTSHNSLNSGLYVTIAGATTFNNVTLSGEYLVTPIANGANAIQTLTFTITAGTNANATSSGGGSAATASFSVCTNNNPIAPIAIPNQVLPTGFTLSSYGSQLVINPIGGGIYLYNPTLTGYAPALYGSPAYCNAVFVTPERIIAAIGAANTQPSTSNTNQTSPFSNSVFAGGSLCVMWSDQVDPTQWVAATSNTAQNGRTLQGGDYFVGGLAVRDGVSLIFTNKCCFAMQYSGDTFVYNTPLIGDNCGLVGPYAVSAEGGVAFWMGDAEFWGWSGSVAALPSDDVRSSIFPSGSATAYLYKAVCGINRLKKQARFWYPAFGQTENSVYLIFQIDTQVFSTGTISRTGWTDSQLFQVPLGCDATGKIYLEETGTDANGSALDSSLTFAPVDISNGDMGLDFFGFIPDFQRLTGNISLSVNTRQYPQDTLTVSGPYTITANDTTPQINLRCFGKQAGFSLESNVIGGDYRVGLCRVDFRPAGYRD